jgi:thiopeptide-type bacteriocin biosynthesis protein
MPGYLTSSPAAFFVFRTPLLAFDELVRLTPDSLSSCTALKVEQFEQVFSAELAHTRANLKALLDRPEIWEAMFLACPEFERFLDAWERDPDSKRGKRAEVTIVRYFARMAGRATPFGLLAGISHGTIGEGTCLNILGREKYKRRTSLSVEYATTLLEEWERDPVFRKRLLYRPNSSLYRAAGHVRYVEAYQDNQGLSYRLVGLRETRHLREALARAHGGATSKQLARILVGGGTSWKTACEFVEKLIECQVLRPELEIPVTGQQAIQYLVSHLPRTKESLKVRSSLRRIASELAVIDESGFARGQTRYQEIQKSLASLAGKPTNASLFHVTLLKPAPEARLGRDVLAEITRGINILHHLPQNDQASDRRQSICFQEFASRYGRREVPLVEALDNDIGISCATGSRDLPGLAAGLTGIKQAGSILLLKKFSEAVASQAHEITLSEKELKYLESPNSLPLPSSFAMKAVVASTSGLSLARGEFQVFLEGVLGSSGVAMFARFCQFDKGLMQKVRAYVKAEEARQPGVVFAEVVHLPGAHAGDLVFRPVLRRYEIPYLGKSGAPLPRHLPITDLMLSARGERLRVRSRTLGREVIVRMTNAHNFAASHLVIYRFLCSLQQQGVASRLWWDWGVLADAPFLPRVASGRLVLCLARWRIAIDEISQISSLDGADQFRFIQEWRKGRQIPRWVAIRDDNQNLPVDLCNPLGVKSFVHFLKQRSEGSLQELFPAPGYLSVRGPEGSFVHDLLVPFLASSPPAPIQGAQMIKNRRRPTAYSRVFPPLSEWIYVKLYTGAPTSDAILRERISSLVAKGLREGLIARWFFLRYRDPDGHLRLRFQGSRRGLLKRFLPLLQREIDSLVRTHRVWRVQFDTYEREVERYGGDRGILLAEQIFHLDSQAVLAIMGMLEPGDGELVDRWRLALRGVDLLFADFDYQVEGKRRLVELARAKFTQRITNDDASPPVWFQQFRKEQGVLESILGFSCSKNTPVLGDPMASSLRILRERSRRLAPTVSRLKALVQAGDLSVTVSDLALSFVHMHLNRLLRFGEYPGESEVYDSLARLYKSAMARPG